LNFIIWPGSGRVGCFQPLEFNDLPIWINVEPCFSACWHYKSSFWLL